MKNYTVIPKGFLYMITAAFLFGVMTFLIKLLDQRFSVWDISFFRFFGSILVLLTVFGRHQNLFKPKNLKLMLTRGIVGSIAFLMIVFAIRIIPLSTAMVFFYSFPAFSAIFSPVLFGDRISRSEILFITIAMSGVVILFDFKLGGSVMGQVMALSAGIFAGLTVSLIKKLREDHGSVIVYFYFCLVGFVVTTGPFLANPQLPESSYEWIIVGSIIITATAGQIIMNRGFRYCKSWEGGLFLTSELIFTSIFGIILLSEIVSWRFWTGGFLIFASTVAFNYSIKTDPVK